MRGRRTKRPPPLSNGFAAAASSLHRAGRHSGSFQIRGEKNVKINDRTFLITGGGSGLGAATAKLLAASGGNVVIADINSETGEKTAAEIGANARFARTNVA